MSDMAYHTPDAALAVAVLDPVTANPPLPGADAVADILRDMRAKERELWTGRPPRMGCFAVALMLDAYIDRLAVAIGEAPPPKGSAPGGGELVELGRQKLAAQFEAARLRDLVRRLADALDTLVGIHDMDLLREARDAIGEDDPAEGGPATAEKSSAVGNAAALRKALKEQLRYWDAHVRTRDEEEMRVRTVAALSAPPRNCDKYGAYGAAVACRKALGIDWSHIILVRKVIGWLFAPAEGGAE